MKKIEVAGVLLATLSFLFISPLAAIGIGFISAVPRLFECLGLANGKVLH